MRQLTGLYNSNNVSIKSKIGRMLFTEDEQKAKWMGIKLTRTDD